ncbi:LysR family transcriptional regulator [Pseudomonas fluorescens]|uniref:LysR family transcriptional regulator n=1 Tax=Pseudomonas fluorescens TaxID=294 RepID=A0A379ID28_PSEFL|nr:hypothetical protein HZ99_06115 [Pseudomonas fluorescens]SUD30745.1 LysR family transcriptional regulator [Pseudomonas fluorescens]
MEQRLGVRLFHRSTRRITLTAEPVLRAPLISSTIESLNHMVHEGLGIACLPDTSASNRHAPPKRRVFIDHLSARLFPAPRVESAGGVLPTGIRARTP